MERVGIVPCRFSDNREFQVGDQGVVWIDQRDIDLNALSHTTVGEMLDHSVAIRLVGECAPEFGQVVLRTRVLDVGQDLAPLAYEV